ncbi:diaphanous 1 like protein [Tanacetum coccineum]
MVILVSKSNKSGLKMKSVIVREVQGTLSLSNAVILSFSLPHDDVVSEFELITEELLMSDSVIKIYGALRMSVKFHLMLNSKMLIDGDGERDPIIATLLLEASNLLVLKISADDMLVHHRSNCKLEVFPMELIHPPEDYNFNSTLSFTLQICRIEEIIVKGSIEGSVVHFQWVRTVSVMDRMASDSGEANKLLAMVCQPAEAFKALLTSVSSEEQPTALGELMYKCHYSYSACGLGSDGIDRLVQLVQEMHHREPSVSEMDRIVQLVQETQHIKPSVSGDGTLYWAKITGGGFGGTIYVIDRNSLRSSEQIL